jgi:hypothetical protein
VLLPVSRITGALGGVVKVAALPVAEWISGAYRHGSKGHILGRQQSDVSEARCPILVAEYPTSSKSAIPEKSAECR